MRLRPGLVLVLFAARAAWAQPAPPALTVAGFSPPSGPPGSEVTISGHGFGAGLHIFVADHEAGVDFASDTTLQFHVPPLPRGAADITLRAEGMPDVVVGKFSVSSELVIQSFAPQLGPAGTRVELRGGFFERGDVVTLGGLRLPVIEGSRSRLIVAIPAGAPSDVFVVTRASSGARAMSPRKFTVTSGAAPFVSAVEPASGPPGTPVQIRGGNFGAGDTVTYGGRAAVVGKRSEDTLEVMVPKDARTSEPFVVHGKRGEASAPAPFELLRVAVATLTPAAGPPGTRVEIAGIGFVSGDEVLLGTLPLPVAEWGAERVAVLIPEGATTGAVTVRRGGQVVATGPTFTVRAASAAPVVDGFAPAGGPPGTEVTLTGQGLGADVRVSYDDLALIIYKRTDTTLVVKIPRGAAHSAPFVVANKLGATRTGAYFQLAVPPAVDGIAPTSGPVGTEIAVRAPGLHGDEVFYLGSVALPVVERVEGGVRVTVPPEAASGVLSVEAGGKRVETPFRFEVSGKLAITSFAPLIGAPGTKVTLRGENLATAQLVSYGSLPCVVAARGKGELVVEVPAGAVGSDRWFVDAAGQRARSELRFTVALAVGPTVGAFAPASGAPGTQVTLAAAGFAGQITVTLGGRPCEIVERGRDRIVVVVPEGASGRAGFVITDEAGRRHRTAEQFEVVLGRQSPF